MDVRRFISENIVLMDGAMGTMLQNLGHREQPDIVNITAPEAVKSVHLGYLEAGARMILTNTLGANRHKLAPTGYESSEVVKRAVTVAKEAAGRYGALVALDIGSIGELLEPMGTLRFDEAYELFKIQVEAGREAGADAIAIETMTDLLEVKCALLAAKENSDLPVLCTMSFDRNMRTFMGAGIPSMALTLEGLGADAIGFNCSVGPAELYDMVQELVKWTNLPIIAKPNAGMPSLIGGCTVFNVTDEDFKRHMERLLELGVGLIGGCCGTSPAFISKLAELIKNRKPEKRIKVERTAVCSYSKAVEIDRVRIIGERINPTGKKRFQQALLSNDMDYIVQQAIEQTEAGADILDINAGMPGIDEIKVMTEAVKSIQSVVDAPLQIDSSKPEVIEAALRIYNGKPIVNSVNGKKQILDEILPLVKKYGAAVVGLTLDENGIPKSAAERCAIAERIVSAALAHGIPRRDIFIDCLTLTAGAEQEIAYETINAIALVKNRLNVKTVLGVSNISFGLPARERLNQVFLSLALANGLDLPIVNPNNTDMVDTVYCYHQLKNIDAGSIGYMDRFRSAKSEKPVERQNPAKYYDMAYCIENGLKDEIKPVTENLLKTHDGMALVHDFIIPALDSVGAGYERGTVYLPQLLRAAEAAKAAFELVRANMPGSGSVSNNKIILATVKGDIHDIGKNIVKAILENYGFMVIDLGRDVDTETIRNAAVSNGVRLIGLSALMTTTVESMEKTIRELRDKGQDMVFMVGGAVLTEKLAESIGADYYAKDAMAAVAIAKSFFA